MQHVYLVAQNREKGEGCIVIGKEKRNTGSAPCAIHPSGKHKERRKDGEGF